jgi:hypothetical protein
VPTAYLESINRLGMTEYNWGATALSEAQKSFRARQAVALRMLVPENEDR